MTELIREQLGAMGLMACGGMAAGLVYELFSGIAVLLRKTDPPSSPARHRARLQRQTRPRSASSAGTAMLNVLSPSIQTGSMRTTNLLLLRLVLLGLTPPTTPSSSITLPT